MSYDDYLDAVPASLYRSGIRDCITAIADVAADMSNWSSAETERALEAFPDLTADQWVWCQRGMHRAIAAIGELLDEHDRV